MAKTAIITLSEPLRGHKGPITQVELREPKSADVFALGMPHITSRAPDGSTVSIERDGIFELYFDRLAVGLGADDVVGLLSLEDYFRVRDAINGFFSAAAEKVYGATRDS